MFILGGIAGASMSYIWTVIGKRAFIEFAPVERVHGLSLLTW